MSGPRTAAEIARVIADTLERHAMPYAIGGAIALGFYAAPRTTVDVDVNVFLPPSDLDRVLGVLAEAGFTLTEGIATIRAQANNEGQFRGTIEGMRVDVFVPAIPYYAELAARRRQVPLLGRPLWILGAEDLLVLKMVFFRRKDLGDVEAALRDQGGSIDRVYIRRKLAELVGSDDERLTALAEIEADVFGNP